MLMTELVNTLAKRMRRLFSRPMGMALPGLLLPSLFMMFFMMIASAQPVDPQEALPPGRAGQPAAPASVPEIQPPQTPAPDRPSTTTLPGAGEEATAPSPEAGEAGEIRGFSPEISPATGPEGSPPSSRADADLRRPLETVTLYDPPPTSPILLTGLLVKQQEIPVDLETVLRLVERQSLPLERDTELVKRANTQFYRSLANFLPDVVGSYQQSRFVGDILIFEDTVSIEQTQFRPQLSARWTIFPGGTTVFESLAARQRTDQSKSIMEGTLQDQLTLAAEEFYRLMEAQLQIANVLTSIEEARSQVEFNEARLEAGVGTKLDVMRSRSLLVQQERALIEAERVKAVSEQNLLNRLNLDPDIQLGLDTNDVSLRRLVPEDLPVERLITRAKQLRPAVNALEQEVKALRSELWATASRIVPSVTLEAYVQGIGPSLDQLGFGRFSGLFLEANLLESMGVAVPLDTKTRYHELKQKQAELKIMMRNVESAVINSHLDAQAAIKSLQVAEEAYRVAEEAHRLSVGRFQAGLGINLDVLDAETTLIDARTGLANAILAFNQTQVRLLEAVGETSIPSLLNGIRHAQAANPPSND